MRVVRKKMQQGRETGLLGADYVIDQDRYRIAKIYKGENWNPELRSPLTEPGVDVHEGDYLLAVNGTELKGSDEIFQLFQGTAGKSVVLTVASQPSGKNARKVTVAPISYETNLRNKAWIDANRRKVEELSSGRLAYVLAGCNDAAGVLLPNLSQTLSESLAFQPVGASTSLILRNRSSEVNGFSMKA